MLDAQILTRIQDAEQKVRDKAFAKDQPELAEVVQSLSDSGSSDVIPSSTLIGLAAVLRQLGNGLPDNDDDVNPLFKQAQKVLNESFSRYQDDTKLTNEQGNLYYDNKQYDRARASFDDVIWRSPPADTADRVYALEKAGASLRELRNFPDADDMLRQAVDLRGSPSVRLLIERGWLRFYQTRYEKAFTDFAAAQDQTGPDATDENKHEAMVGQIASHQAEDALNSEDKQDRAKVLMDGWREPAGVLSDEDALSILTDCDSIHTLLNLYQAALRNADLILHIDENNQEGLCLKIEALTWLRQFKKAEKLYCDAQKLFSNNIALWKKMGQLHYNQKRFREAYLHYSGKVVKKHSAQDNKAFTEALKKDDRATEWTIVSLRKMRDLEGARREVDEALERGDKVSFLSEKAAIDYAEREYESAIKYFARALAIDDYDEFARQWSAACYRKTPEMVKATPESDKATPDFAKARTALDEALLKLPFGTGLLEERAWLAFDQGDFGQAGKDFDSATKLDPYLIQRQFSRIECFARLSCWDDALEVFDKLAKQFPNDAEIAEQRCWFYLRMGRPEQAKEQLDSIKKHHPGNALGLNARGGYELDQRKYAAAAEWFRKAIEKVDYEPQYHINLAVSLLRQLKEPGEMEIAKREALLDQARESCRRALALDPYNAKAHGCLGVIAYKRSAFLDAELYFLKSIELSPPEGSYVELAALYCQMGRYDEAREKLKEALALNRKEARAYIEWGNLSVLTENNKEAVRYCRDAVIADPNNDEAQRALAIALIRSEQYDEAEKTIREGLRIVPASQRWQLYLLLSQLSVRLGDLANKDRKKKDLRVYDEAQIHVDAARQDNPSPNADIFFHAGIVQYKRGNYPSAQTYFAECVKANRDRFEADRYGSIVQAVLDQDKKLFTVNKRYSIILAVICSALLIVLWSSYYAGLKRTILLDATSAGKPATAPTGAATTPAAAAPASADNAAEATKKREPHYEFAVDSSLLTVMTPILLGLLVVAALLPNLTTLKLPGGFEANISEPKLADSEISSGPQGEIGFGSSLPVISPGPR